MSSFRNGWIDAYDLGTNKYDASYINPKGYEVRLDAGLGLRMGRAQPIAMAINPTQDAPATLAEFLERIDQPGDDLPGGGDSEPQVPDDLVAFSWTITEQAGSFHETKIVQRPVSPMMLTWFRVPRAGTYNVRLTVSFADGRFGERTVAVEFQDWFVVSLGDSSASGEGNPDEQGTVDHFSRFKCRATTLGAMVEAEPSMSNPVRWSEPRAHRSVKSGPALAALSLQRNVGHTFIPPATQVSWISLDKITFATFARSGAAILSGLVDNQEGASDYIGAGQLEECKRTAAGRRIDALMINIGGNDAHFAGVLTDLVANDGPYTASLKGAGKEFVKDFIVPFGFLIPASDDDKFNRDKVEARLNALLGVGLPPNHTGEIETHFDVLGDRVKDLQKDLGVDEVYITGYPVGLFENADDNGDLYFRACEIFSGPDLDVDELDAQMVQRVGRLLNAMIKRKAEEFGWHYIDVEQDFQGHGYCAIETDSYWVKAKESCQHQGDFRGTMHPNHLGHGIWAMRFAEALREHTVQPRRPIGSEPVTQPTKPPKLGS